MTCILCSRPLRTAAMYIGAYPIGPVCARRAGLTQIAAKGRNKLLRPSSSNAARRGRDEGQMALDLEVANADQA